EGHEGFGYFLTKNFVLGACGEPIESMSFVVLFAFLFWLQLRLGGQLEKLDLLSSLGWHESKILVRQLRRYIPAPNQYGKLRLPFNLFRRENEFPRQRLVPPPRSHVAAHLRPPDA